MSITRKQTIEALRASIRKWKSIAKGAGYDAGPENCALCKLFRAPDEGRATCEDCPVKMASGKSGCTGTPYDDFVAWAKRTFTRSGITRTIGGPRYGNREQAYQAALKELEFLRNLLKTVELSGKKYMGWKVTTMPEDSHKFMSVACPKYSPVRYMVGRWAHRPKGGGPLCVFKTLGDALDFIYRCGASDTDVISRCEYIPSKDTKVWQSTGKTKLRVKVSRPISALPEGTILADKVRIGKPVRTTWETGYHAKHTLKLAGRPTYEF